MRKVVWGLAVWLAVVGNGAAQSPPERGPASGQKPENSETQRKTEQHGIEQAPFVIQIQQAGQAQIKPEVNAKDAGRNKGEWTLSDKIAVAASTAAALQFFALLATVWVMVRNGRR